MPGVGLLNRIDGQESNSVDAQLVEANQGVHGFNRKEWLAIHRTRFEVGLRLLTTDDCRRLPIYLAPTLAPS